MEILEAAIVWLQGRSRRNLLVSSMFALDMRIGLQIQKLIEWPVVLFLVLLVDRFGYFSHLKIFVFRC
jgi:putative exporter of polyketide antibiotics